MSRSRIVFGSIGVLVLVGSLTIGRPAHALHPTCTGDEHLISWPAADPLWEMCWLRPQDSSGANGSGLELREIYYRGVLVMKRAHEPILNVQYAGGECGPFRDVSLFEVFFQADNELFPGYAEPTSPPLTVCDTGGSVGVTGSFLGVAAERKPTELVLTTQFEASWYKYTEKWTFRDDGTIIPFFGFAATEHACVQFTHHHNNYYRFDFDIGGASHDDVVETHPALPPVVFQSEDVRTWIDGDTAWEVTDNQLGLGYRVRPSADDLLWPADAFAIADAWVLAYKPGTEIEDTQAPALPVPSGGIPMRMAYFADGDSVADTDIVLWYRGGAEHLGAAIDDCEPTGPIIEPIGDWVDTDADTVENQDDNCPFVVNLAQADGDSDGAGDVCDNCLGLSNPEQLDLDEDGAGNACDADDDGDGLLDTVETNTGTWVSGADTGTDPLNADTDSDGLVDGVETNTGIYVSQSDTGTDPHSADTDGDTFSDGYEVNPGGEPLSDPTDPYSRPAVNLPAAGAVGLALLGGLLATAAVFFLLRRRRTA